MSEAINIKINGKNNAGKAFSSLGVNLIALNQGLQLAQTGLKALSAPFISVVTEGAAFAKQMSAVKAISKTTAEEFVALTEKAKEIGTTTSFSATEAGLAMEELRRAGLTTAQVMTVSADAISLAAAQSVELAAAAELTAIQMKIFADQGLRSKEIVDLITQTTGASAQNFSQLSEALKASAGTAAAFNIPFKDLTIILGAMANEGVRGERAGTALNGAFSRLLKPAAGARKVLDKYKISLEEVNPTTQKFSDIIDVLNERHVSQADLLTLLGQEAGPKFLNLIKKGGSALIEFEKAQAGANTASKAASDRLDNLSGDVTIFESALSGVKISIFETLDEILRDVVQDSTELLISFKDLVVQNKGPLIRFFKVLVVVMKTGKDIIVFFVNTFLGIVKVFGQIIKSRPVIAFFDILATSVERVIDLLAMGFNNVVEAFTKFTDYVTDSIIPSISALARVFTGTREKIDDTKESAGGFFDELKKLLAQTKLVSDATGGKGLSGAIEGAGDAIIVFGSLLDDTEKTLASSKKTIREVVTDLEDMEDTIDDLNKDPISTVIEKQALTDFETFVAAFKEFNKDFADFILAKGKEGFGQIKGATGATQGFAEGGFIGAIIGFFAELLFSSEAFKTSVETLNQVITDLFEPFAEPIGAIQELLAGLLETLMPFSNLFAKYFARVKPYFDSVDTLNNNIGLLIDNLALLADFITIIVEDFLKGFFGGLKGVFDGFNLELGKLFEALKTKIGESLVALRDLPKNIGAAVKSFFETLGNNLVTAMEDLFDALKDLPQEIFDAIKGLFEGIGEGLGEGAGNIGNAIGSGFGAIGDAVGGGIGAIGNALGFREGSGGLTRSDLLRLPGMESDSGLIKAHVGEKVTRREDAGSGGGSFIFNISAIDPSGSSEEIRQVIEELKVQGLI